MVHQIGNIQGSLKHIFSSAAHKKLRHGSNDLIIVLGRESCNRFGAIGKGDDSLAIADHAARKNIAEHFANDHGRSHA